MIRFILVAVLLISGFTTLAQKRAKKVQTVHDSIRHVLKTKGLLRCKVIDTTYCLNVSEIATTGKKSDPVPSRHIDETWNLKWNISSEFEGPFYVVITNMFAEYVFLQSTDDDHLEVSLSRFSNEKLILCEIVSANCRKTRMIALKLTSD